VEDRKLQECAEARVVALFRSMSDDCKEDALCILESFAEDSPQRTPPPLRLVTSGDVSD
jgi:hypothetical protein